MTKYNQPSKQSSPLEKEGFFRGVEATEKGEYNCVACLTILKERKYTPNSPAFIDFVQGWKFSIE